MVVGGESVFDDGIALLGYCAGEDGFEGGVEAPMAATFGCRAARIIISRLTDMEGRRN